MKDGKGIGGGYGLFEKRNGKMIVLECGGEERVGKKGEVFEYMMKHLVEREWGSV